MALKFASRQFWTDSRVTLDWIRGDPGRWKQFVSNRVKKIPRESTTEEWARVPGKSNAADLCSRDAPTTQLVRRDSI